MTIEEKRYVKDVTKRMIDAFDEQEIAPYMQIAIASMMILQICDNDEYSDEEFDDQLKTIKECWKDLKE